MEGLCTEEMASPSIRNGSRASTPSVANIGEAAHAERDLQGPGDLELSAEQAEGDHACSSSAQTSDFITVLTAGCSGNDREFGRKMDCGGASLRKFGVPSKFVWYLDFVSSLLKTTSEIGASLLCTSTWIHQQRRKTY